MNKTEFKYWKRKLELDDDLIYKKAGINQASFAYLKTLSATQNAS